MLLCPSVAKTTDPFECVIETAGICKNALGAEVCPVGTTWGSCISRNTCFSEHVHFLETAATTGGHDCHLAGLECERLRAGRLFWATPGGNVISMRHHIMTGTPTNKHMSGEEA